MGLRIGRSRIPELLVQSGKTQAALADHLKVSESFISHVIKGKRQLSVTKLKSTAIFFGCTMDDVYEWIED